MTNVDRRALMKLGMAAGAAAALPPAIARAVTLPASVETGSIKDVQHVVILMQENRSFDHYFGTLPGVRGFNDRFPIPVGNKGEDPRPVWKQNLKAGVSGETLSPYHLDTMAVFDIMRMEGTPHGWHDSQDAWDHGRMTAWPEHKTHRSMGYFKRADLPFQFALAETFTICDAYHCSIMSSTNPNRMFLWTGTNDPSGKAGGPILDNSHDSFPTNGYAQPGYSLVSYAERLQQAGIDWRIYKYMDDYFTNNPLVGIEAYRASYLRKPGANPELAKRAMTTYGIDRLRADVMNASLPQVSYLISPARGSEHPSKSSPIQAADYISDVLEALTSNPAVWAKTAVFIMFDENDGFFDHVPPPAPPSRDAADATKMHGASTIDLTGEYHEHPGTGGDNTRWPRLTNRPYGLGPRVPLYVISPWSRGGIVNSQVSDHTSVIRFLETRFGVHEPNITPWRRAVCGDLTSAFNFTDPNGAPFMHAMPDPSESARRADRINYRIDPKPPEINPPAAQEAGVRPSSPLPYDLEAQPYLEADTNRILVNFRNNGTVAAVFHVYDRLHLERAPCRYTVGADKTLHGIWELTPGAGAFDLWILGPNGFHRHFAGHVQQAALMNGLVWRHQADQLTIKAPAGFVAASAYREHATATFTARAASRTWAVTATAGWYDFTLTHPDHTGLQIRVAGRFENGKTRLTDPLQ